MASEPQRTAQVFPRSANTIIWISILAGVLLLAIGIGSLYYFTQSAWARGVGQEIAQPVPYSHQLHVGGLKIDCRYCHNYVEESSFANIPATETCMSCHSVIRTNSPNLALVRESWTKNVPIEWNRVHDLPDFVYFNHSSHIAKGVGCSTCHGNIAEMPVVHKVATLQMGWCLDCHRNPEKYVRPKAEIYNTEWRPPRDQLEQGRKLVQEYRIRGAYQLTNCAICHR